MTVASGTHLRSSDRIRPRNELGSIESSGRISQPHRHRPRRACTPSETGVNGTDGQLSSAWRTRRGGGGRKRSGGRCSTVPTFEAIESGHFYGGEQVQQQEGRDAGRMLECGLLVCGRGSRGSTQGSRKGRGACRQRVDAQLLELRGHDRCCSREIERVVPVLGCPRASRKTRRDEVGADPAWRFSGGTESPGLWCRLWCGYGEGRVGVKDGLAGDWRWWAVRGGEVEVPRMWMEEWNAGCKMQDAGPEAGWRMEDGGWMY